MSQILEDREVSRGKILFEQGLKVLSKPTMKWYQGDFFLSNDGKEWSFDAAVANKKQVCGMCMLGAVAWWPETTDIKQIMEHIDLAKSTIMGDIPA